MTGGQGESAVIVACVGHCSRRGTSRQFTFTAGPQVSHIVEIYTRPVEMMTAPPAQAAGVVARATRNEPGPRQQGSGGWRHRITHLATSRTFVYGVSVVIIGALLTRVPLGQVETDAQGETAFAIGMAFALNIPVFVLRAVRTRYLLGHLGHRVHLAETTAVNLVGQTLSSLTPAASGDLGRSVIWNRRDGIPVADGVVVVIFERFYALGLMLVIGVAGIALALANSWDVYPLVVIAFGGSLLLPWCVGQLPYRTRHMLWGFALRVPLLGRGAAKGKSILAPFLVLCRSHKALVAFIVLTLAIFALSGAQIGVLVSGVADPMPLWIVVAVYCLSQSVGSISSLPFGLGPADVVTVAALSALGLPVPLGTAVAVLIRVTVTVPTGVCGAVSYALVGTKLGTARPGAVESAAETPALQSAH